MGQIEVIKQGGKLSERKELWERAIVHLRTPTALELIQKLGLESAPESLKVESCGSGVAGEPCAVCMEPMGVGARIQTLECGSEHRFHHECLIGWLQEKATCPLCREDVSAQCGHPPVKPEPNLACAATASTSCRAASHIPLDGLPPVNPIITQMTPRDVTPAPPGSCAAGAPDPTNNNQLTDPTTAVVNVPIASASEDLMMIDDFLLTHDADGVPINDEWLLSEWLQG